MAKIADCPYVKDEYYGNRPTYSLDFFSGAIISVFFAIGGIYLYSLIGKIYESNRASAEAIEPDFINENQTDILVSSILLFGTISSIFTFDQIVQ